MLFWLLPTVLAEDPPAPQTPQPTQEAVSSEEMVVFGDMEEQRQRQELEQTLLDMGYRPGHTRDNGRTVYRPEVAWHPSVIIDEDGYALIRRSPVRVEPWVDGRTNLRWISCVPPFTLMCVRIGGWIVSERKLAYKKAYVAEGIDPDLQAWRAVLVANAMGRRLNEDIPDMLETIWTHGEVPLGDPLETPQQRREAILAFWGSRACTPEGDAARQTAADFLTFVVQPSPHPVTEAERLAVSNGNPCGVELVLE